MKLVFLFVFLVFQFGQLFPQSPVHDLERDALKRYRKIQTHVRKTPEESSGDIDLLSEYLQEGMETDLEKVRSIYLWIAFNITYDMEKFLGGRFEGQTIPGVLKGKKAICDGYSNLFSALCNSAGIENRKIIGYSKGYGYNPGQKFAVSNHAWNAVMINEEWYLLDVTWAASRSNNSDFKPGEKNLEHYFLTDPEVFLIDHLPEDPQWQLLEEPISLEDFEAGKNVPKSKKSSEIDKNTDVYGKEIALYDRVTRHNPRNRDARFRLGYAYLSKALDTMEIIHTLGGEQVFSDLEDLGERIIGLLDQAEKNFGMLDERYSDYERLKNMRIECIYQKGVFHYEAGFQLITLMTKMDEIEYQNKFNDYQKEVNRYWDQAITYFERIPPGSLYSEQAVRYIDYFIPEYRP
jgi:hypothetical protein